MTGVPAEEIVPIPAVLRRVETPMVVGCVVETWKDVSSAGKAYTRCRIGKEPEDLPDGPYIVEFGGHAIRTNKVEGQWELIFLAPHIRVSAA